MGGGGRGGGREEREERKMEGMWSERFSVEL